MRVIIIGAGIGGCVTALACQQAGFEVTVYESVREIAPLGVGINLLPHAMKFLNELGLLEALLPLGVQTEELAFFNRHGQLIWQEPRGLAAGYNAPQLSVHRGRLQMNLVEAVRAAIGTDNLRTGHTLKTFTTGSEAELPTVELEQRATRKIVSDSGDVVIACDGIHSTIRKEFEPNEGIPHWSGNVLWRGAVAHHGFLTGRSMFMAGHLPHKFVAYPITEPDANGFQVINWIAELNREAEGLSGRETWNKKVDKTIFAERFAEWTFDWLNIPKLIEATDDVFEFPMVDRDPLDRWTYGRVTLLGDAAHPMYPIGSNGASQAILDAEALVAALTETEQATEGLIKYEAQRRPATANIVLSNRQHGPERVLDLAEERSPDGFDDISEVFAIGELDNISKRYKQLTGLTLPL